MSDVINFPDRNSFDIRFRYVNGSHTIIWISSGCQNIDACYNRLKNTHHSIIQKPLFSHFDATQTDKNGPLSNSGCKRGNFRYFWGQNPQTAGFKLKQNSRFSMEKSQLPSAVNTFLKRGAYSFQEAVMQLLCTNDRCKLHYSCLPSLWCLNSGLGQFEID